MKILYDVAWSMISCSRKKERKRVVDLGKWGGEMSENLRAFNAEQSVSVSLKIFWIIWEQKMFLGERERKIYKGGKW